MSSPGIAFVRPMLNAPIEKRDESADELAERVIARIQAAHEANKLVANLLHGGGWKSEAAPLTMDEKRKSAGSGSEF
jgi:hypothetical protein